MQKPDVIVVGSGLSALLTANYLSDKLNVIIFTKSSKYDNNSFLAQGGVACAIEHTDSWEQHYQDTLFAGCYHNDENAVKVLTQMGPELLREIVHKGMKFDKDKQGNYSLGMEGAHSKRRILHAGGDQTGKKLMEWLQSTLSNKVQLVEHETVIKLEVQDGVCSGVQTINNNGMRKSYFSSSVVLATGGAGALYPFTSNNISITGMALSLAYQAGAALTDLEFMQFHPTMLSYEGRAVGLISEAVRGEGAYLETGSGKRFMEEYHPLKDLAPRDVVSRAIFYEMEKGESIYLNIEHVSDFVERFPAITALCKKHNICLEKKRIPVVPGAHFYMGGIFTNINGETTLPGLFAVGEAACNGVHGANRLASNSLLETMVFSKTLADHLKKIDLPASALRYRREELPSDFLQRKCESLPIKSDIQQMMMQYAGIVRNEEGLFTLKNYLEIFEPYWKGLNQLTAILSLEEIETIHMLQLSFLITEAAIKRTESRGTHYRTDHPVAKEAWKQVRIMHNVPDKKGEMETNEQYSITRNAASIF
ncbi:L-aspartate oxidase [Sutcliffiella rhizosphaerae]|uniref:L-aspartate oxidase n=1 Tax=Sutcliffiella rhizosphaerae TaxID=2880967 RepID=A0ABM8YHZ6_9BACI|nr:L-aspartate oxidase [Sutcliffiella rhizosphaerae]CAG9619481.1 L-aspartate oxidase [Sutcliffiella rhizosphaerae]